MPYIGRAPSASITKLEDADQDTKIQVEESSDEDIIRFDIAGAEDFRMAANSFNVLSGSTLTIDSGATITNSGTANNFGTDMESAYAGVLQTNANFVDQVIFGPSVDGRAWNGLWNKASLFSSLMLATIEDEGSNTEINIWDLTEQSSGAISTTPLATVDLSAAATPTAIAACMGYLIVSSEDGVAIIDPHSGSWAERTKGWPRTLSSSTVPALTNNDVEGVAAGFSDQPAHDPRTGGPLPTFACSYGTGADIGSIIKDDGNVFDKSGTVDNGAICLIQNGKVLIGDSSGDIIRVSQVPISSITADDWAHGGYGATGISQPMPGLGAQNAIDGQGNLTVAASSGGMTSLLGVTPASHHGNVESDLNAATAMITRTYNTGYLMPSIRGAWLANSKTTDHSTRVNTLTENGTVTEGAVESGAELNGYSGFSGSNYFSRSSDADWTSLANGNVHMSIWFKSSGNSAFETYMSARKASPPARIDIYMENDGTVGFECFGDAAETAAVSTGTFDDGVWHKLDGVQISNNERHVYVDGVLVGSNTTNCGSLTSSDMVLGIGARGHDAAVPATSSTLSLAHFAGIAPSATQVRQMYEAEKGMFVASAECFLQSGSTDAVLDVNVDPLTSKVLVTQTDAITVFDGLVVDSKPSVNSGNSEKGKLWGALRAEQNSANAYVTAPAVDQRQVNEMVRGLANELPKGVDLSKAKAYVNFNANSGAIVIKSSFNIESSEYVAGGNFNFFLATKMKNREAVAMSVTAGDNSLTGVIGSYDADPTVDTETKVYTREHDGSATNMDSCTVIWFGELENE